jgi:SIR2-like protein
MKLVKARKDFASSLPRLVSAYESGRLVPFVGSGLSVGACTTWPEMIRRLERCAFARPSRSTKKATPSELIERANSAVRALKTGEPGSFEAAMQTAVVARRDFIPSPTLTLASVWWPLVLTTNYDNCYVAAFVQRFGEELHAIVGRSAEDCQRVLTSLGNAGRPLLWALQGHLNVPCSLPAQRPDLAGQLVVGHEEYRRVTYRDPVFRRAFAEVFRQRSLFFLGAGINENYLKELFGEVLEIYGPSGRPHYAIMPEGEVDPDFMLSRFQIRVFEFPKKRYEEVDGFLRQFAAAVGAKRRRPFSWSFGGLRPDASNRWDGSAELEIERTYLPTRIFEDECMVLSGESLTPAFAQRLLHRTVPQGTSVRRVAPRLHEFTGHRAFILTTIERTSARYLAAVYDSALTLFRKIGRRFRTIRMQLVGTRRSSGGSRWGSAPRGRRRKDSPDAESARSVPAQANGRFVLIQTVRAFRDWHARNPTARCKLVLHLVAESVTMEIASGRLDVLEILSCEDVRFATEIVRDDRTVERRVFERYPRTTRLRDIVKQLDLSVHQWTVEVSPWPTLRLGFRAERPVANCLGETLHALGVLPGGTLHFRRRRRGTR